MLLFKVPSVRKREFNYEKAAGYWMVMANVAMKFSCDKVADEKGFKMCLKF